MSAAENVIVFLVLGFGTILVLILDAADGGIALTYGTVPGVGVLLQAPA
jgi:hypothetical protein